MSLSLTQTKTALAAGLTASFLGVGGVAPLSYAIVPGGAGGTINAVTGLYTAPSVAPSDPKLIFDTIRVTDSTDATAISKIMVAPPLLLLCEIIQREMGLAQGRVFIWDQKIFQPSDEKIFVVVGVGPSKPFGNVTKPAIVAGVPDWSRAQQEVHMMSQIDIDIISRSTEALIRKEEVLMALNSLYSEFQQEANSFNISRLPTNGRFINLSVVDGAAIPYRFRISVNMQYTVTKTQTTDYFDTFSNVQVNTDS